MGFLAKFAAQIGRRSGSNSRSTASSPVEGLGSAPHASLLVRSDTPERKELVKRRVRKMRGNRTRKVVSAYEQTHALMLEQLNG